MHISRFFKSNSLEKKIIKISNENSKSNENNMASTTQNLCNLAPIPAPQVCSEPIVVKQEKQEITVQKEHQESIQPPIIIDSQLQVMSLEIHDLSMENHQNITEAPLQTEENNIETQSSPRGEKRSKTIKTTKTTGEKKHGKPRKTKSTAGTN